VQIGFPRFRGRGRRQLSALLAISGLAFAAILYLLLSPSILIVAVESSSDGSLFNAFSAGLVRERASVRLQVRTMADPASVHAALEQGDVHLAIMRADRGIPVEGRAVAKVRENVLIFLAPADSKIESVPNISGHTLGLVGPDVDPKQIAAVLRQYDVDDGSWRTTRVETEGVAAALKEGQIDLVAVAGSARSPLLGAVVGAFAEGAKIPLFIPIELAEAFVQRNPYYESTEIAAGTFQGNPPLPPDNVTTVSFAHYLIARRDVSEQSVSELTRRLFEARLRLAQSAPDALALATPSTEKDAPLPAHPGALAYFNDSEKTFFDRYGDWIYILAMIGSLLLSVVVGLANYHGSGRLRQRATARRLTRLLGLASAATTADELTRIEDRAEAIVTQAMLRVEAGTLPADAASALSVKRDLIRNAVAERQAALKKSGASRSAKQQRRKRLVTDAEAGE